MLLRLVNVVIDVAFLMGEENEIELERKVSYFLGKSVEIRRHDDATGRDRQRNRRNLGIH